MTEFLFDDIERRPLCFENMRSRRFDVLINMIGLMEFASGEILKRGSRDFRTQRKRIFRGGFNQKTITSMKEPFSSYSCTNWSHA